jgi:hypothetical protein
MTRVPTLHPYRPYRSAELVTGEGGHLAPISRRDGRSAETVEELMQRLREICRVAAFVDELEVAVAAGGQDAAQRAADAQTMLEGMFRRAGDDLRHVAQTVAVISELEDHEKEND